MSKEDGSGTAGVLLLGGMALLMVVSVLYGAVMTIMFEFLQFVIGIIAACTIYYAIAKALTLLPAGSALKRILPALLAVLCIACIVSGMRLVPRLPIPEGLQQIIGFVLFGGILSTIAVFAYGIWHSFDGHAEEDDAQDARQERGDVVTMM